MHLGRNVILNESALLVLALEDWSIVARHIFDAMQGRLAAMS